MPGACFTTCSLKPLVRSVVTLLPGAPSRMATLPLPPSALIIWSAARLPCSVKSDPMNVR